jgi:hypothetical protein
VVVALKPNHVGNPRTRGWDPSSGENPRRRQKDQRTSSGEPRPRGCHRLHHPRQSGSCQEVELHGCACWSLAVASDTKQPRKHRGIRQPEEQSNGVVHRRSARVCHCSAGLDERRRTRGSGSEREVVVPLSSCHVGSPHARGQRQLKPLFSYANTHMSPRVTGSLRQGSLRTCVERTSALLKYRHHD